MNRRLVQLAAVALLGVACAGGPPVATVVRPSTSDLPFLVDPVVGYRAALGRERSQALSDLARRLRKGELEAARLGARRLLVEDETLTPATLLLAQADFVERRYAAAESRVIPLVDQDAQYTSAQLLLGRTEEMLGNLLNAWDAYHAVADVSGVAEGRREELRPRLAEILRLRFQEGMSFEDLAAAEEALVDLAIIDPEGEGTLESRAELARALEDPEEELRALRGLNQLRPRDWDLLDRRADLELEVGDSMISVEILQGLLAEAPDDDKLKDRLDRAKFRWRLRVLPADVQELARVPELTRSDFARLLFWSLPGVRAANVVTGSIASDLVAHPHQRELVRVVNVGLMGIDRNLRWFRPGEPVTRQEALEALLRYRASVDDACTGAGTMPSTPSITWICEVGTECGLITESVDCLPGGSVSGEEAIELIRRAAAVRAR